MQSFLESLNAFGGIYVAMFLFAILSGVFFLANSETALIALAAASNYSLPKLLVLAVIVALGQSVTHAILFWSARSLTKVGAKKRPRLEAKIAKARELGARRQKPPQALIALLAGAIDIRFRTFVAIDVPGRIARFVTIVLIAYSV